MALIGAVEAGGTKFVCALVDAELKVIDRIRIPTGDPIPTIAAMLDYFATRPPVAAFGVASFGPVRLDRDAADWGRLLATPKLAWRGASLTAPLAERFGTPVALDTDVNAAALAEQALGAAIGTRVAAYLTIGTGIGLGVAIDGRPLHGLLHPEFGHVRVARDRGDDWPGICPLHGDCLEGLASGPAIAARWGASLSDLAADHPAHAIIASLLGQALASLALTLAAERIVIGGGVARAPGLRERARAAMHRLLGDYLDAPALARADYVTAPRLGDDAAIIGAAMLARAAPGR